MKDKITAFEASDYDKKIKQTLPYYEDFYEQIIGLVKAYNENKLEWLDVGCGTGKMATVAFENVKIKRFTFCDCSSDMLEIAQERFAYSNAEFSLCDVRKMKYSSEFDVVTAVQVNHYFKKEERRIALQKCYEALKENGLFITFENFAAFSDLGKEIYLNKWKKYQMKKGKSSEKCNQHVERYGKEYFPITLTEHMELMRECGFRAVEILWLSNMQIGIWGVK